MIRENLKVGIQQWLTAWFAARSKSGKDAMGDGLREINYFDSGWLSSMEVVEFVTEIEQKFDMQFSETDLQDSRFATINGLAELIAEHMAQTSASSL